MGGFFSKNQTQEKPSRSLELMDEVFLRFLHLAEQIFENLDDASLLRSRVVARTWKGFIDYKDYPLTRIQKMVADLRENCKDDGSLPWLSFKTPLQLACGKGQVNLAKAIMTNSARLGIELNAKNWVGRTAFHLACYNGHSNVAEMLMKNSVQFNIELNTKDNGDTTAFHLVEWSFRCSGDAYQEFGSIQH